IIQVGRKVYKNYAVGLRKAKDYKGAVHKELVEKEIAERLPSPSWAELLSGFSWVFNLREGNGELIYPDREEGELICAVKKGIPDWPEPTQWDEESVILKWNYQFTENYLKQSELDKIRLTAPDILLWLGEEPSDVVRVLEEMSLPILEYDKRVHTDLREGNPHDTETHVTIIGDFSAPGREVQRWTTECQQIINKKGWTHYDGPANAISINQSIYNLTGPAITNLYATGKEYSRRLMRKVPPPLHVFPGEKIARKYELEIFNRFQKPIEELHPLVVSALEDELLVKNFAFGLVFDIIEKDTIFDDDTGDRKPILKISDVKLPPEHVEAILKLRIPPDNEAIQYAAAARTLHQAVLEKRKNVAKESYVDLLGEKTKAIVDQLEKSELPKTEAEISKVFLIILEKELESLLTLR
ncbi:hypothetical protein HKBW3C_02907, partial [Candidatus Hakubella thermalkaliphila]